MGIASPIDFDNPDGFKVFRGAFDHADEHQKVRDDQCEADYNTFHAVLDMTARDPDRANIAIPKLTSIIQTKAPKEIRAAIGRRPYIPFDAIRDEYGEQTALQVKMLDQLLYLGGFAEEFTLMDLIKICYGTAFMEGRPYYTEDIQRIIQPQFVSGPYGPIMTGYEIVNQPVLRLRLALTTYAQWELRFDPFAKTLSTREGCRYVIKMRIASKREIIKIAESGGYGEEFDTRELIDAPDSYGSEISKHRGLQILTNMGLTDPGQDSDIGVLFRYETPDRYIDVWNDHVTLRDVDNPYSRQHGGHGLINLSRVIHNVDPHTQARFWGNGEVKINECLQSLLNDTVSMTMDNHNFLNIGMTKYAKGRGVSPDMLISAVGNKIGFELQPGEKIGDLIQEDRGQSLPRDHYAIPAMVQDWMDLTASSQPVMRGEESTGNRTLGEISMLREAGDSHQELNVKTIEDVFLKDFGQKCLGHVDQFSRHEDKVELLGEEDANKLIFMNPRDLPGGYNYTFTGSDRVVNQAIRQHNLINLDKRMSQSPLLNERGWVNELLDAHELSDKKDKVLISEEEEMIQAMQMAAMAQQEQQQAGESGSNKGTPSPDQAPTPAKKAQETGNLTTQMAQ
ncbi:MAG: hypothetical protein JRC86_08110 [Deltaproteobacteria bacterium]|nr:hypothetical protein [Deltaproteobacteria bacterium]